MAQNLLVRVAVISDVHANLYALEAVLREIDRESPDEIWCLGDTVGYGPHPNECCDLVRDRADVCLVGNHDLAVLGGVEVADFNYEAAAAANWTREALEPRSRDFLASLEPAATAEGAELFHASPRNPVWEYVLSNDVALAALDETRAPVVLVGHSHVALAFEQVDGRVHGDLARAGFEVDLAGARWLLNPGSVGQPRDGDARAAWLLLDFERRFGAFRRVAYSIEATQRDLRAAGLPESLALRLQFGQ
jgi:diadenosine tetraphosphatase ApaH/serine/threonine PP2A family protein phosphatase